MPTRRAISSLIMVLALGLAVGRAGTPTPQATSSGVPTATTTTPLTRSPADTRQPEPSPASPPVPSGPMEIRLQRLADGLNSPVALAPVDDGSGRLFVVDRIGLIHVLTPEGEMSPEPFLDLRERMVGLRESYDERGLLGLDFHPDFQENGRFFVYYSAPLRGGGPTGWDHTSHISEFRVAVDNPNRADPNSERALMMVDQP